MMIILNKILDNRFNEQAEELELVLNYNLNNWMFNNNKDQIESENLILIKIINTECISLKNNNEKFLINS